jgi:hypothetical protein
MFYTIARKKNIVGKISYENGRLSGEPMLLQQLLGEIEARNDQDVGPIMYSPSGGDHSKDPLSIRLIMEEVFDQVEFFGNVPDWPLLPEGGKG